MENINIISMFDVLSGQAIPSVIESESLYSNISDLEQLLEAEEAYSTVTISSAAGDDRNEEGKSDEHSHNGQQFSTVNIEEELKVLEAECTKDPGMSMERVWPIFNIKKKNHRRFTPPYSLQKSPRATVPIPQVPQQIVPQPPLTVLQSPQPTYHPSSEPTTQAVSEALHEAVTAGPSTSGSVSGQSDIGDINLTAFNELMQTIGNDYRELSKCLPEYKKNEADIIRTMKTLEACYKKRETLGKNIAKLRASINGKLKNVKL